jgi:hypothetical protein
MIGNNVYVIEYGGQGGNIWRITLPADVKQNKNDKRALVKKQ